MARSRSSRSHCQQRQLHRAMHQLQTERANSKQRQLQRKEEEQLASNNKFALLQQLPSERSVPSSPTLSPESEKEQQQLMADLTATADSVLPSPLQAEEEQQPSQPPSPPSEQQQPAPSSPTALPSFTPEEESMRATIRAVREKLAQIEFELPMLQRQIELHCSRVGLQHAAATALPASSSAPLRQCSSAFTPSKLHLAQTHLHYSAGMVDERVMQAIFKLDSIQTSNPLIRAERKATVAKGNTIIAESIQMRNKLQQWAKFLPPKEQEEQSKKVEATQPQQPASPTNQTVMAEDEEEDSEADEEEAEESDEEMEQKYAEPAAVSANKHQQQQPTRPLPPTPARATPAAPALSPATPTTTAPAAPPAAPALTPLQRKYAHLRLPVWVAGPTFRSRVHPSTGALVIESDMAGVLAADLAVTADPTARTLTVRGVKLPVRRSQQQQQQRRQSSIDFGFFGLLPAPMPVQPVEPHGFFTRVISLADLDPHSVLDLESMRATMDAQNKLEVTIPRHAAPVRRAAPQAPAPQQQQRHQQLPYGYSARQPTRHAGYHSSNSEEEEDADVSNLFFQQRAAQPQRQTQSRMQYQRPSPFFGSSGWW